MFTNPDRQLAATVAVMTLVSMAWTGFFGWVGGGEYTLLCILGAIGLPCISLMSPLLWASAGRHMAAGRGKVAIAAMLFGSVFMLIDAVTNIGAVFMARQTEIVGATNQNTKAGDLRGEVKRLNDRIASIKGQAAWQTSYLDPAAYDSLIAAAELIRNNEAKRGGCGRLCEDKTKELASLQANKANALQRRALLDEMRGLERELVDVKARSADTQTVASAALTQIEKLAQLFTGSLAPTADMKERVYLLITAVLGLVMSIAPAVGGFFIGHRAREASGYDEPAPTYTRPLIASDTPSERGSYREERVTVHSVDGRPMTMTPSHAMSVAEAGGSIDVGEIKRLTERARARTEAMRRMAEQYA